MALCGKRISLLGSVAAVAMVTGAASAFAGGFALREQSADSQGASFAGNGAGTGLSSMYWNPAAAANKSGPGINLESSYSVILPHAIVNVDSVSGPASGVPAVAGSFAAAPNSSDIGHNAFLGASYASYQLAPALFLGLSVNSGFGLSTEPQVGNYDAAILGGRTSLFTLGATPTLAYQVSPWISIGAGVQVDYASGRFKFATGVPQAPSTTFQGDDYAFGATAGIMLTPAQGTRIGLGWRSALTHELDGTFNRPAIAALGVTAQNYSATAKVNLPDIVTLSLNQALSSNLRLLGTVEWANWSRFSELRLKDKAGVVADVVIDANWVDSWFFSIGAEYDVSSRLTVRSGVGYEYSPIDDAKKRLVGIPDNNRVWLSAGATYKLTEATSVDVSATHLFVEDGDFDRKNTTGSLNLKGSIDASTNIFSAGLKTKF